VDSVEVRISPLLVAERDRAGVSAQTEQSMWAERDKNRVSGSGAVSGGNRNRYERWADISPLICSGEFRYVFKMKHETVALEWRITAVWITSIITLLLMLLKLLLIAGVCARDVTICARLLHTHWLDVYLQVQSCHVDCPSPISHHHYKLRGSSAVPRSFPLEMTPFDSQQILPKICHSWLQRRIYIRMIPS